MVDAMEKAAGETHQGNTLRRALERITHVQKLGMLPMQQQFIAALVRKRFRLDAASDLMRVAYVLEAVRQCKGNQTKAARMIGIHRNTLRRIVKGEL